MHIAFISYEYPPDTAFGGIATYVNQMAHLLVQRGVRVSVFTAGPSNVIMTTKVFKSTEYQETVWRSPKTCFRPSSPS